MRREDILLKVEQMMLETLEMTHNWWKATAADSAVGGIAFSPPPNTLTRLYKDVHAAIMASLKANVQADSAEGMDPYEMLARAEAIREDSKRKIAALERKGLALSVPAIGPHYSDIPFDPD